MRTRFVYTQYVRCIVLLLSLALVGAVLSGPTVAFIVTRTSSLINTFISGLAPEGGIIIRKAVEHPFEDTYVIPDTIGFGFRVDLGEAYAGQSVITTQGTQTADSNGSIIVTVKPGESVGIREIVAGTSVTVTELAQAPGFAVSDGILSQTVTVVARKDTTVRFVNTYTPAPVPDANLEVIGVKNLEGRPWQEGDTFTFCLEQRYLVDDSVQWDKVGTASVSYDSKVAGFNFFDLTQLVKSVNFNRIGTYSFRVSEIQGVIGGVTYDELISYFDVQISDTDMDGYLEIAKVTGTAGAVVSWDEARELYRVNVTFSNHYAPSGSAAVSIPIRKLIDDRSGQSVSHTAEGFTFELYSNGLLLQTSEPTSASGDTGFKLVYEASQAGKTFTYVIKETGAGTVNGPMIYDATEHTVHVTVIDNLDGTVRAEADVQELAFANIYDPADATVTFAGTKVLEGRGLREGEFSFHLYQTDAEFTVDPSALPFQTATNTLEGIFSFAPITYDRVGNHYYVIREDAANPLKGIIYDETVYHLAVAVTDENGVLTATTTVTTSEGQAAEQLIYRNVYRPAAALLRLGGRKILHGATLTQGQFHFTLFAADESFNAAEQPLQTVTNSATGTFSFKELTFDQPGTYRFVIREEIVNPVEDMIYDDTVYAVTVSVTDDGEGTLQTITAIQFVGGDSTNEIVFENVYMPDDPTPPDKPTDPDVPEDPEPPKTDNPKTLAPYFIMIGLSLLLLLMLLYWEKDNRRYK